MAASEQMRPVQPLGHRYESPVARAHDFVERAKWNKWDEVFHMMGEDLG